MRKLIFFGIIFPIQVLGQTEMWIARYDGPFGAGGFDHAYAIAVDDSGYIYVTGESLDTNGWQDYATIKYNNSGDTVWVRRYDGPANCDDDAYAIAVDKKGNVYVTGRSVGIGTYYDYATVKYNSSGDTMWARRYNYSSSSAWNGDYAYAIAVDNNGSVYVTGRSDDSATVADYATIKYDSLGNTIWVSRYDSSDNKGDAAYAITTDNNGNVYVTGNSPDLASSDYATIKYNSSGDTVWVRRYSAMAKGYYEKEYKYDNNKGFVWGGGGEAIAVDNKGNVYVTGCCLGNAATIKYNSSGDTMWVRKCTARRWAEGTALTLDNKGNVYVTGRTFTSEDTIVNYITIKYDSLGDTMWVREYNGPGNGVDCATGIAVDESGNVYVTGQSDGLSTYPEDYATIKYSSLGNEEWVKRYNGTGNMLDCAYAIALDNKGYVYVTGSSSSLTDFDYATIKYSTVGVEEKQGAVNSKQLIVKAYPNPFVNTTDIRLADSKVGRLKDLTIKIYDISGKLVESFNKAQDKETIIGKNLKAGIYFVKVGNYNLVKIVKMASLKK